jgi:Ankyrin repeats (many copies)
MSREIPQGLVDRLVEIGRSENFRDLENIGDTFPEARHGGFMRLPPDAWNQVADTLSENKLVSLIKALTLLEQHPNFKAGSVAPVIWLFRRLPNANGRVELINWILNYTENDYLPFGSSNHGAKSLDDYHYRCAQIAERSKARHKAEEDRQCEAKVRKANEASQRLFSAIRRKDAKAVEALLARGADCNAVDESGQTALEYASSLGLGHLFGTVKP